MGCVASEAEAAELLGASPDPDTIEAWLVRRSRGEPLAWLTGTARFAGRSVQVAAGVYVPRPQTEELARRAAARLPRGGWALDLCTGAGAVAAHLCDVVPSATVIGIDSDVRAATCARRNGVVAMIGFLADTVAGAARFDVVTAVAPYVPTGDIAFLPADVRRHEPRLALDGGLDGLDLVRPVVDAASRLLRLGGALLVEVGGDQDRALAPALDAAGFDQVEAWHDDDGDLRGLEATRRSPTAAG